MSELRWDHTIHCVNDLDDAVSKFKEKGLTAFYGGSHTKWGTHNALSYFGLSYIEFLSIENKELLERAANVPLVVKDILSYLPENESFSRVALRTDDIRQTADTLKKNGLILSDILDGKRLDAKGNLIEWKMLMIHGDYQGLAYPFIIQWQSSDESRLKELTKTQVIQPHSAGQAAIEAAVFYVSDPEEAANHWKDQLGLTVSRNDPSEVALAIGSQEFLFRKGTANSIKQLHIKTDAAGLKGESFFIGEAEYVFT